MLPDDSREDMLKWASARNLHVPMSEPACLFGLENADLPAKHLTDNNVLYEDARD